MLLSAYLKKELFDGGFIADSSSHSRGSTVDLTLDKKKKKQSVGPENQ